MLKIKHQATCLDLSQKSSSSNTPTSDYYLKHYHQPKCNQPGHKFVDEDQEKNLWTVNKTQNIWTLKTSPFVPCFGGGVFLNLAEKIRKFGLWYTESCTTPYSTILWCTQVTKNTQEYSYTNRYTGALQLSSPNQPVCLLWYRSHLPTRRSIKTDDNNSPLARYNQNILDNSSKTHSSVLKFDGQVHLWG